MGASSHKPFAGGGQGTVCWLETPLNPIGESRNIKHYADKVHGVGGKLIVDSTFGPPPLQDPFTWGADIVVSVPSLTVKGYINGLG